MTRRSSIRTGLAIMAACFLAASVRAGGAFSLLSQPSGDVFIVTDVTKAGKAFRAPTKDSPIRCLAVDFGCSFGAKVGDGVPETSAIRAIVLKILAEQGYRGHDEGHPPELLLTFQWGYMEGNPGRNIEFLGGAKLDLMWETQSLPWIDPRVLLRGMRNPKAVKIMDVSQDDLYVMTVCGFDYAAYRAGRAELLWRTRIACSTIGHSMQMALPGMIEMAGPAIGRETKSVIIANPSDKREGRVIYGELEVVGEESTTDAPEAEKSAPDGK